MPRTRCPVSSGGRSVGRGKTLPASTRATSRAMSVRPRMHRPPRIPTRRTVPASAIELSPRRNRIDSPRAGRRGVRRARTPFPIRRDSRRADWPPRRARTAAPPSGRRSSAPRGLWQMLRRSEARAPARSRSARGRRARRTGTRRSASGATSTVGGNRSSDRADRRSRRVLRRCCGRWRGNRSRRPSSRRGVGYRNRREPGRGARGRPPRPAGRRGRGGSWRCARSSIDSPCRGHVRAQSSMPAAPAERVFLFAPLSRDEIVTGEGIRVRTGGAGFYAAWALARHGARVTLHTPLAAEDHGLLGTLPPEVEVIAHPSRRTTRFRIEVDLDQPNERILRVLAVSDPLDPERIGSLEKASFLFLGPLLPGDLAPALLERLRSAPVPWDLGAQGLVRRVDPAGRVRIAPPDAAPDLPPLRALAGDETSGMRCPPSWRPGRPSGSSRAAIGGPRFDWRAKGNRSRSRPRRCNRPPARPSAWATPS